MSDIKRMLEIWKTWKNDVKDIGIDTAVVGAMRDYVDEQQVKNLDLHNVNHRFLTMKNIHDWGESIFYMENSGKAFCRTYWYYDDKSTIYFDWLNVIETARGNGIATELLNIHIKTARELKVESCLSVKKGTWMHEWYKRKGYKDLKDNENESNAIWMNRLPENGG